MVTNVGANPNFIRQTNSNKMDMQKSPAAKTFGKRDNIADRQISSAVDKYKSTDLNSLYESEQASTFFRIAREEPQDTVDERSAPPRVDLTEEELAVIQNELNTSDDPLKFYNAAWDLLCKGVLKTDDLPKTFELRSASGEVEIIAGWLPEFDPETLEDPIYVEDFIKTILAELTSKLESSTMELTD